MAISEEWRRRRKDVGDANGLNTSGSLDTTTGGALPTNQDSTPTSGFVNLQQYLDTNKGAGEKIAGAYTGDINKKVDTFKTTTDKTAAETAAGINAAGDSHVQEGSNLVGNINANMTGDLTNASNFANKSYVPDTLKTDDAITAGQTDINNQLGKVDDTATQQAGLMSTFGKDNGNYGSGFAGLDRFIMGGDESGRAIVAKTKGRTGEVNSAVGNYGTMKSAATTAAQKKLSDSQTALKNAAKARKGSIEANNFGTRIAQKNATYGDNENTAGASIGDVMSGDEKAYLDALSDLSGGPRSTYGSTFKPGTAKAIRIKGTMESPISQDEAMRTFGRAGDPARGNPDNIPMTATNDASAGIPTASGYNINPTQNMDPELLRYLMGQS
jgi:hypothetical protein